MTRLVESLGDVAGQYDALFVDLWGCVHDGLCAFPDAVAALCRYRAQGGAVVLLTNSPSPGEVLRPHLGQLGIPDSAYDALATSGDSARLALFRGVIGTKVFFMGQWQRDAGFFRPPRLLANPLSISCVPLAKAQGILCCGPFDALAPPTVHREDFLRARTRGLKLLCANPDIVVDRGGKREWCAGALARLYRDMGGESLYFGKPWPPIYDLARRRLRASGRGVPDERILAIGDGIGTDIAGAQNEGLAALFITGGLAARETHTTRQPDAVRLASYLAQERAAPAYAMGFLC